MMIKYPKVFSISTINIRQHYNCDYLVHSKRTDFSGDSGSGKSMIADMIQLILVGSDAFKSSTSGNEERHPKGMVVPPSGRNQNTGYVFLNIEISKKKFLVIGVNIQSSNNRVKPFIIQNGYDWSSDLIPFENPVTHRDLIVDEQILSIELLSEKLERAHLKTFSWREYHRILYSGGLVSLDLSNDKTLESFSAIFRSLSRGKGFKLDSSSLKDFLFGDNEKNALWSNYKKDVASIQNDYEDHKDFIRESKRIKQKQDQIKELLHLHKEFKTQCKTYCAARYWFWNKQNKEAAIVLVEQEANLSVAALKKSVLELKISEVKTNYLSSINKLNENLNVLKEKHVSDTLLQDSENAYLSAASEKKKVEQITNWLAQSDWSVDTLNSEYAKERKQKLENSLLAEFTVHLQNHNILHKLTSSEWTNDFEKKKASFHSELKFMESELARLKAFSVFANLDNEQSLARWAIGNLDYPVSHEVESALVYFQQFPLTEPKVELGLRYLANPDELFDNPKYDQRGNDGFWLCLLGVNEFIPYTVERLLDHHDNEYMRATFKSLISGNSQKIEKQEQKIQEQKKIFKVLTDFGNTSYAIELLFKRGVTESHQTHEMAELNEEEFQFCVDLYHKREAVVQKYELLKSDWRKKLKDKGQSDNEEQNLKREIKRLTKSLELAGVIVDINNVKKLHKASLETQQSLNKNEIHEHDFLESLRSLNLKDESIESLLIKKPEIEKEHENWSKDVAETKNRIIESEKKLKETLNLAFSELALDIAKSEESVVNEDPDVQAEGSLLVHYTKTKSDFEAQYRIIRDSIEEKEQLEGYSVGQLANKLLPTIFKTPNIDENLIEEKIAERLSQLADTIQELGSRKIEILIRVVNEVYEVYQDYLNKISRISRFLQNYVITGGTKASLEYEQSSDFPDDWISSFRKQVSQQLPTGGLFDGLQEEIDVNRLMTETFRKVTGKPDAEPEDLLNPKSFFDLDFKLTLATGKQNAGSNGQTYTANALLGLARLSLIEDSRRNGIKLMPIDEAEGLGSNYELLSKLAAQENYQIISMSIDTAGDILEGEQNIYILSNNTSDDSYVPPAGIFSDGLLTPDIEQYIQNYVTNE